MRSYSPPILSFLKIGTSLKEKKSLPGIGNIVVQRLSA